MPVNYALSHHSLIGAKGPELALIVSDGGEPTFRYYRKTCCVSGALVSLGLTQPEFGWPVTYPSSLRTVLERSAALSV